MKKQKDWCCALPCLHCDLLDTVAKYSKKHGLISDSEIISACVAVINDVMEQHHDQKAQAIITNFVALQIASALKRARGYTARRLHIEQLKTDAGIGESK